ncbi:MAG: CaiB/BaiF CoA-transferase family protein [Pseudomonadota bacterium]
MLEEADDETNEDAAGEFLPLAGIRVVEFSHMVMGPACGLILADLGAEVLKVEPTGSGDKTRALTGSGAGFFPTYNRNKRSVAVDLKDPKGLAFVRDLVRSADVLIENFRPDGMEALGLGYRDLKPINPQLIYCSAKGFLPGPYEHRTALDEVVQMMGGLAYMTGPPGRPLRAGASVNDVMGGMFGAIGVLAALRKRDQTGEGSYVCSSLYETCVFLCGQHMAQKAVTGHAAAPMPARISAWAVYDVFSCSDGEQVFVGVVSDAQWKKFCDHFGLDHLKNDPTHATNPQRCAARDRFLPELRNRFGSMTSANLMEICERLGLPFAPIRRPEDLFEDPHLLESGGLLDVTLSDGRRVPVPGLPLTLDGWRPGLRHDLPLPGADTRAIAREIGISDEQIRRLEEAGILGGRAPSGRG